MPKNPPPGADQLRQAGAEARGEVPHVEAGHVPSGGAAAPPSSSPGAFAASPGAGQVGESRELPQFAVLSLRRRMLPGQLKRRRYGNGDG